MAKPPTKSNQPQPTFFDKLKSTIASGASATRAAANTAVGAFRSFARLLQGRTITGNQFMRENNDRLFSMLRAQHIGRMCMFYYDPKLKDKLPYYDRFPLVIPIQLTPDGFIGLNLHYLPPAYRATLMDSLYTTIYKNKHLDEKKRIQLSYQIVKSASRNRFFIPCVKRYLYDHLRSRVLMLEPKDWNVALFMPTERFEKARKRTVWQESVAKIRGR